LHLLDGVAPQPLLQRAALEGTRSLPHRAALAHVPAGLAQRLLEHAAQ
jgi:hypothetical protein